jgi:excisionase family DNA binding protein
MSVLGEDQTLYRVRDVADVLGVHPETVRRLIRDGRLDAVREGRALLVTVASLERMVRRLRLRPVRST